MFSLYRHRLTVLGLVIGLFISSNPVLAQQTTLSQNGGTAQTKPRFLRPLYIIPGFSRHLIQNNYIIHQDLGIAKRAANHRDTLRLRIALADANGHLLQMETPPALAGLRDQLVAVSEQLDQSGRGDPRDPNWDSLLNNIQRAPLPSLYHSARAKLEKMAQQAQTLANAGHLHSARTVISKLMAEIEITAHIFPTNQLRYRIQKAILDASHDRPRWGKTTKAISEATEKTQWLLQPVGQDLIKAYDANVAAYIEWPQSDNSRKSLRLAYLYLEHIPQTHKLAQAFLDASRNPSLQLHVIIHLQNILALYIHRSRSAKASPPR